MRAGAIRELLLNRASLKAKSFIERHRSFLHDYLSYFSGRVVASEQLTKNLADFCEITDYQRCAVIPSGKAARELIGQGDPRLLRKLQFFDNNYAVLRIGDVKIRNPGKLVHHEQFQAVFVATQVYVQEIVQQLHELGVPDKKIFDPSRLAEEQCFDMDIAQQTVLKINENPRDTLVFPCIHFSMANLDRLALLHARHPEKRMILMTAFNYIANGPPLSEFQNEVFDAIVSINGICQLYILSQLDPETTIMTSGNPFFTPFVLLISLLCPGRHVHEVYDCVDELTFAKGFPIYHHHRHIIASLGEQMWTVDHESKHELSRVVERMLFRDSPSIVKSYTETYQFERPTLRFLPYQKRCTAVQPPARRRRKALRLAHCGHIVPPPQNCDVSIFKDTGVQKSLFDTAAKITAQKIHFHLFNPIDLEGRMGKIFRRAIPPENRRYFAYRKPLFGSDFASSLAGYDFGWMVYDFSDYSPEEMPSHHHTVSTKLFSYFQAGVPVIISQEYHHMVELCRPFACALVIAYDDILSLGTIIEGADVEAMRRNAKRAQEEMALDRHIDEFIDFVIPEQANISGQYPQLTHKASCQ